MNFVYIMLAVAVVLLVYQMYYRRDDDNLDNRGRPRRK
jgi:hypothetical protein